MMEARAERDLRYEVKFVGPATTLWLLEHWIGAHSAGFFEPYPPRRVNNVYFDTFGLGAYEQNLMGSSVRQKVRLRWYGSFLESDQGTLEVKCRRNRLGWKLSYPVRLGPLVGIRWSEIRQKLRSELPEHARMLLDHNPLPVLINSYRRRYFLSRDGDVRLTLDWDQHLFDQRLRAYPNLVRRSQLPEMLVVEFKFGAGDHRLGSAVIQGLPLRLSRNSKYVVGVESIAYG